VGNPGSLHNPIFFWRASRRGEMLAFFSSFCRKRDFFYKKMKKAKRFFLQKDFFYNQQDSANLNLVIHLEYSASKRGWCNFLHFSMNAFCQKV